MSLALKYRPQRFTDLVGQRHVQVILQQMLATGRVPSAVLLRGSRGTGKTTTARILAAGLNCAKREHTVLRAEEIPPCGSCPSCIAIFSGSSLDLLEIDAASNGLVEDIRTLRQQVLHHGGTGRIRVVVWDEAQSISAAGFNAVLKLIEEPPAATVFVLVTTESRRIPDTVASRCMIFDFRRLSIADITDRLQHVAQAEGITVEEPLLRLIAEEADGAMRDALMRLDQIATIDLTTVEQYHRLIGYHDPAPAILYALTKGKLRDALTTAENALTRIANPEDIHNGLLRCLRDALMLHLGADITRTGTALAACQHLALVLDRTALVTAMRVLWQASTSNTQDTRALLDMSIALLADILVRESPVAEPSRISFSEMIQRA